MAYKTLLVAADQSEDSDARVGLACTLAVAMDAHIIGVCGIALSPPPIDDPYTMGAMVGEALSLFRDVAEAEVRGALKRYHDVVGSRRDRTEWRGRLGWPADVVVQEARAADLVILGRRSSRAPAHAVDPADVLLAIGRPVLVVPPKADRDPIGWPAVIAWKDTREAQRAAASALPLLRHASIVHVLEICGDGAEAVEDAETRTADVVGWLERHGISAESHVIAPREASVAQEIISFAESRTAGLIVSGGYGHARLREWALGGVTQALLAASPVAVLLTH